MDNSQNSPRRESVRDVARESFAGVADSAVSTMREAGTHYVAEPAKDVFSLLRDYAKDKPDVAAMWALGIGIMIGWKLRG
jgi:site-specific recombinase